MTDNNQEGETEVDEFTVAQPRAGADRGARGWDTSTASKKEPDWENFGKAITEDFPTGDLNGADLFELCVAYGLLKEIEGGYDPDIHDDSQGICPEAGDPWYEYTFRGEAGEGLFSIRAIRKEIAALSSERDASIARAEQAEAERDALRFRAQNAESEQSAAETAYSVAMRQLSEKDATIARRTARIAELESALRFGCGAAITSLHDESGNLPEWSSGSGIAVMLTALGCHEYRLNEKVRAALSREGGE